LRHRGWELQDDAWGNSEEFTAPFPGDGVLNLKTAGSL